MFNPVYAKAARTPGALPPQALEKLIGKVRAVDMDEVRRKAVAGSTQAS